MRAPLHKARAQRRIHIPALRAQLGLSQEALAQVLEVSVRTVARWERREARPSPLAQRRLALLLDLLQKARALFKREQDAAAWLSTPNPLLGDKTPLDRLAAPGGLEDVRDLLGRIEWGLPS